jgi:hypothetical protein
MLWALLVAGVLTLNLVVGASLYAERVLIRSPRPSEST